jgi:ankyrin repeat protein
MNLLIEKKANVNATNRYGFTPLMCLNQQTRYIDPNEYTYQMIYNLIPKTNLDYQCEHGYTALMIAAGLNELHIVIQLLKAHAHKNLTNFEQKTPYDFVSDKWSSTEKEKEYSGFTCSRRIYL